MATPTESLATVQHSYTPSSENEIALTKGEVVRVMQKFENGWWVGQDKNGKVGAFPSTYVREHPKETSLSSQHKAIAIGLYDYHGIAEDELSFKKGDEIHLLTMPAIIEGWERGKIGISEGLFPSQYVRTVTFSDIQQTREKIPGDFPIAVALYKFQAMDPSELSLQKGDLLRVLLAGEPDAWWRGQIDDRIGHFPGSYVKILSDALISEISSLAEPQPVESHESRNRQLSISVVQQVSDREPAQKLLASTKEIPEVEDDSSESEISLKLSKHDSVTSTSENLHVHSESLEDESSAVQTTRKQKLSVVGSGVALYNFKSDQPGVLSFKAGDTITIYERLSSPWWKGKVRQNFGYFPVAFIKEKKIKPKIKVRALHDYSARSPKELSFKKGEEFFQRSSKVKSGWCRGEAHNVVGYFPQSFVEIISRESIRVGSLITEKTPVAVELLSILSDLQQQLASKSTLNHAQMLSKISESELIRQKQSEQLRALSLNLEALNIRTAKLQEQLSKQQKSIRKLSNQTSTLATPQKSKKSKSSTAVEGEDFEKLVDMFQMEARSRRDLESIARNLETQNETLSRSLQRLHRQFDEHLQAKMQRK